MKKNKGLKIQAQEWFDKGDDDLKSAKILYKEKGVVGNVCFHAHQTVEKYLKGFLVYRGKDIEDDFKIHNLIKLFDYCQEIDKTLSESIRKYCLILNRYYIPTRYPSIMPIEYKPEEAKEAIKLAEKVKDFIQKKA